VILLYGGLAHALSEDFFEKKNGSSIVSSLWNGIMNSSVFRVLPQEEYMTHPCVPNSGYFA
jgi:hypothetical protein